MTLPPSTTQPTPGAYPAPYPAQPVMPPPPRKSRAGLIVAIVIGAVVLLFGGCAALVAVAGAGGTDSASTTDGQPVADQAKPNAAGIGTPVRDGNFEFVVKSVKCGQTKVGNELLGKQAQGQFCMVAMTVQNIKSDPQPFSVIDQRAFGPDGAEHAADGEAAIYVNEGTPGTFIDPINPGNAVTGTVVFDIPAGGKIAELELHDSPFSNGVRVKV